MTNNNLSHQALDDQQRDDNVIKILISQLLEVIYIITHDGHFNDIESVEETLLKIGCSQKDIDYHNLKQIIMGRTAQRR